jgi:hypothetical protein
MVMEMMIYGWIFDGFHFSFLLGKWISLFLNGLPSTGYGSPLSLPTLAGY